MTSVEIILAVIRDCGGTRIRDMMTKNNQGNLYFIGEYYSYLDLVYAIAAKIPCLNFKWIIDCIINVRNGNIN